MRYLMHTRMTRGCAFLDSTDMPVAEIAREVGFRDAFHFSKAFHAAVGIPPRAYRKESFVQDCGEAPVGYAAN